MSNQQKAILRQIFREAAGLIASHNAQFCCDAIGYAGYKYDDRHAAKAFLEENFRPPDSKVPVGALGWWWHTCDARVGYNPREARITALLLAAELV